MGCLQGADILLPVPGTDLEKWAVIACDQFTGQPEYWEQVQKYVGDSPSALRIIYPEAYLSSDTGDAYRQRIAKIQMEMKRYLSEGILSEAVHEGYVLVIRETGSGIRVGLAAALDLEAYEYKKGVKALVRATEETVSERIPARVGIREEAVLESPHAMLLFDDREYGLLENLYKKKEEYRRLYDVELMFGGGRLQGYAIDGKEAEKLTAQLEELEQKHSEPFLAVGDGNHSLAAAKACWEIVKSKLPCEKWKDHPARYALTEIVDLRSPALEFQAIHRVLYGGRMEDLMEGFREYLGSREITWTENTGAKGTGGIGFVQGNRRSAWHITDTKGHLAVELVQHYLDGYLARHKEIELDYIHSRSAVEELAEKEGVCGILLEASGKDSLFPAIRAGNVLPRKAFSVGKDSEKRYYMECRRIM